MLALLLAMIYESTPTHTPTVLLLGLAQSLFIWIDDDCFALFCFAVLLGHFLYVVRDRDNRKAIELLSPWYQESGPYCRLSMALHMNNMEDGNLKIVVETRNHTWVVVETLGNDLRE